jgi:hypothetical protein
MNPPDRQSPQEGTGPSQEHPVPVMQEIYDNIWFLFLISGVIILVFYIIWALIDLLAVPISP